MKYRVRLVVTQRWWVEVDAANTEEAIDKAKSAYDESANPWEDLESSGDEQVEYELAGIAA